MSNDVIDTVVADGMLGILSAKCHERIVGWSQSAPGTISPWMPTSVKIQVLNPNLVTPSHALGAGLASVKLR